MSSVYVAMYCRRRSTRWASCRIGYRDLSVDQKGQNGYRDLRVEGGGVEQRGRQRGGGSGTVT